MQYSRPADCNSNFTTKNTKSTKGKIRKDFNYLVFLYFYLRVLRVLRGSKSTIRIAAREIGWLLFFR